MDVRIKQVTTEKDIEKFHDLFTKTLRTEFPEYSQRELDFFLSNPWSKESYKSSLSNKNKLILIAEVDGKTIGVLDGEIISGGVSLCMWVMVAKEFQGKGIGTALISKWESLVKNKGIHNLYLYADGKNISYYEKIGFESIGLWKKSWFGKDHYVFSKIIQEPHEDNYLK